MNKCHKIWKVIWVEKCGLYRREGKYIQKLVGASKGKENHLIDININGN
jgi:hypothetical protein